MLRPVLLPTTRASSVLGKAVNIAPPEHVRVVRFSVRVLNHGVEGVCGFQCFVGERARRLDFDKAFAFLRLEEHEDRPWRKTLIHQNLNRHSLYPHLPALGDGKVLGQNLWDSFEEWWLGNPTGRLSSEIGSGMADPDLDLPRLEAYLKKFAVAADDFSPFLTDSSR